MFQNRAVCFAVFDEEVGPISLYSNKISKTIADKVALKTILSTVSVSQEIGEGESIIPFQEEEKIAFVYYFSIPDAEARGGMRIFTLSFVVDREDGDALYRFAHILSEHSKKIVQEIKKHYTYKQPLPQNLIESIDSILSLEEFERAVLPDSFKEYLIRSYLSKDTAFHRSIMEKTKNISRHEEILGETVDIVGRDKNRDIVWVLLLRNFSRMSEDEKQKLYSYLDRLRGSLPSLEVIFVLNELGLRKGGAFDEKAIEGITHTSRISEAEGGEFDLCGTDGNENIIWALISKNFLAMSESEMDELNKKIYRLKRTNPSMEAFFTLAEIIKSTKLPSEKTPKPNLEGKPPRLRKIMGVKTEYQSLLDSLRKNKE